MKKILQFAIVSAMIFAITVGLTGCLVAAAGAGAEAGYVATQDDRTTSETLTDQRIVATIKTEYVADSQVSAFHINIDSMKGHVTLRGFVSKIEEEQKAINIAENVSGVVSVTSKLTLQ